MKKDTPTAAASAEASSLPVTASTTESCSDDSQSRQSNSGGDMDISCGTQTRFRFYEPEPENKDEKKENATNNSRFSFYDDVTRQELAAVENNLPKVKTKPNSGMMRSPHRMLSSSAIPLSDSATDEILRSLQETEDQRSQILQTDFTVATSTTAVHHRSKSPLDEDIDNGSNPYEDAIKEALDLLRKHRSPPATPALGGDCVVMPGTAMGVTTNLPPTMVNVDTASTTSESTAGMRARTPREKDRLLQHRMDDDNDDNMAVITGTTGNAGDLAGPPTIIGGGGGAAAPVMLTTLHPPLNDAAPGPSSPGVVEDLTDVYEEHKLKAKQRQERMAQYASRLQEFKSSLPAENVEQHWPPSMESNVDNHVAAYHDNANDDGTMSQEQHDAMMMLNAPIPHVASHNEESVGFSDISHSTKEQLEAEVQRGVERVLLAILERANVSRGRGSTDGSEVSRTLSTSGYDRHATATTNRGVMFGDAATTGSSNMSADALLRAMDKLGLGQVSTNTSVDQYSDHSNLKTKTSVETEGTGIGSKRSATSVVDELLAEEDADDDDMGEDDEDPEKSSHLAMVSSLGSPTGKNNYSQSWGLQEEKKLPDSQENVSKSAYGTIQENEEDVDRLMDECLRDDLTDQDETVADSERYEEESELSDQPQMRGVLGPLSKRAGGTTGVVLNIEQEEKESVIRVKRTDRHDPKSKKTESKSNTLDRVKSTITYKDDEKSSGADKYSTPDSDDDDNEGYNNDDDSDDEGDLEATELMRTLCAHLLPFGVDQKSNRVLEAIPDWDESNQNEAGYRIIRLSKVQLRRVEYAFETMINGLKRNSERQLNGAEESGDAKFVRELREAERLLDESEESNLRAAETVTAKNPEKKVTSFKADIPTLANDATKSAEDDEDTDVKTEDEKDGHPDFPGVKATGKGEMGDLEYFHLPIVFKSHVTGFEATKELLLEPGNVIAGQYLVESELGTAAFSTAYRCIDLSSESEDGHEEVCLKVIKNTKDFFDQSLDEIKILELLRQTGKCHENHVVEMKCFFYYREHLIIVTELLRQNLFEFGKFILDNNEEPYFTIPRLAYITRQALISLRFVHSLGLVHSDVKPENVLLGSYSRAKIKLIDFGSSCYLTDRQSSYIQSRSYRAPEVVLGLPYDGKIDVWSLGCVVAEMFTGEVTFQNDSIVSMLSRIEAICGPFPRHMIAQGRQSGRFFTKSGLLYEVVDDAEGEGNKTAPGPQDDDEGNAANQFDIFQPKNTRLSGRLGFDADLMEDYSEGNLKTNPSDTERQEQQMFTDFLRQLLTIDPDGRPNADGALKHPWMQYAASLTEEQVKYPSS